MRPYNKTAEAIGVSKFSGPLAKTAPTLTGNKVTDIKAFRAQYGIGLHEAKEIVDKLYAATGTRSISTFLLELDTLIERAKRAGCANNEIATRFSEQIRSSCR